MRLPDDQLLQYHAIEAVAGDDVWLVGTNFDAAADATTWSYIAHWDGREWQEAIASRLADVVLEDVFAYASDAIWAVGNRIDQNVDPLEPVVLRWDGSKWNTVRAPRSSSPFEYAGLSAVAATSAEEIWGAAGAPGGLDYEELLRWDGRTWTASKPPFATVGSIDAANGYLWAAGVTANDEQRLIARMDADGWEVADTPATGGFAGGNDPAWGVVAVSDEVAIAVGREAIIHTGCIDG